jgi:hypothetical protein
MREDGLNDFWRREMAKERNKGKVFFIIILFLVGTSCFAKEVEATNFGIANATAGDYIIRSSGQKIILKQGDIDYAKRQIVIQSNKSSKTLSSTAENGDIYGADNDGDGRIETIFVRGYYRKNGTYVRSHYRAPRR